MYRRVYPNYFPHPSILFEDKKLRASGEGQVISVGVSIKMT
jgi:hypothetical protein